MVDVMDGEARHNFYLDELVNRLYNIDEDYKKIQWIMKDGIWKMENQATRFKLCDLILVYYGGRAIPVELKGSRHKRTKAIIQINSGRKFIETVLNLKCD